MREILFRGKRVQNGKWVEGSFHRHETRQICPFNDELKVEEIKYLIIRDSFADWNMPKTIESTEVIPETVGQYTGLTDKNGRKIFEGDIIKNNWCLIFSPNVVKYGAYAQPFNDDIHTKHIGFYIEHTGEKKNAYRKDLGYFANKCEVIGNIHDNPELLEGGENNDTTGSR